LREKKLIASLASGERVSGFAFGIRKKGFQIFQHFTGILAKCPSRYYLAEMNHPENYQKINQLERV